jgi:hypothetical protein
VKKRLICICPPAGEFAPPEVALLSGWDACTVTNLDDAARTLRAGGFRQFGDDELDAFLRVGTLLMGYSYRLKPNRVLNVSVGAGLTRDTPDVTLSVRVPMTF